MGIAHVFDTIGDKFARRQRIEHAFMSHGYSVVYCDSIEFASYPAGFFNGFPHNLPYFIEMDMPGNELGKRVYHRNYRLSEVLLFDSCCSP